MVRQAKTTGSRTTKAKEPAKPSPVSNIGSIASLKRYNDKDHACSILHEIVKLTAPIIHENNFKVGTVCEMYPKNANLLGLNVNRGQKILIRLRSHANDRVFLPLPDLIETFLHELSHNLFGAHDSKFYKFLDGLKARFDRVQYTKTSINGYRCEEERLGSNSLSLGYVSIQEKRLKALTPKFKTESRKLGTLLSNNSKVLKPDVKGLRELRLQAIERMRKDSKWCRSALEEAGVEPNNDEIEVIAIDDFEPLAINPEFKQVVDLTNEEYDSPSQEIIVIDGCETSPKLSKGQCCASSASDDSDQNQKERRVQFLKLLPSFDEEKKRRKPQEPEEQEYVNYSLSSSPSHFIEGDGNRHKYVANLNFQQILEKGKRITAVPKPAKKKKKKTIRKKKSIPTLPTEPPENSKFKKVVKPILFKDLL